MRERGHKSGKIPWLLVSTVAGIVIVVVMALLYFSGSIPVPDESAPSGLIPAKTVSTTLRQITPAVTVISSGTTRTQTPVVTESTPIIVPPAGVYVRVDYIGSFNGTYGTNGMQQTVRQSGTRWYPLSNVSGTVFATFQKEDGTTKNALTVGIYKDGKLLRSDKSSEAFGKVEISADL
ncbi:MAG: hypothetical protein NTZ39_04035 [Methanoregula sp.]|nr:hypothetical protein [Methanoregula sp.]